MNTDDQYDSFYFEFLHRAYQKLSAVKATDKVTPGVGTIFNVEVEDSWWGPLTADRVTVDSAPSEAIFEAVRYAAESGISPPHWAIEFLAQGWDRFRTHEVETLGDAYGVKPHTRTTPRKNSQDPSLKYRMGIEVAELQEQGASYDSAVQEVAETNHKGRKTVEAAVTSMRKTRDRIKEALARHPYIQRPDGFETFDSEP